MGVRWYAGSSQFPAVIWVDADKRGDAIYLIFGARIEGQGAALRIRLTSPQWGKSQIPRRRSEVKLGHYRERRCRAERHTGIPRARPSTAVTTKQSCKHPALSPLRA